MKAHFLIANRIYISDGIRSALGLVVENMYAYAYIFYNKMITKTQYMDENVAWIRDMEGDVYAVVDTMDEETAKHNTEGEWDLTPITIEELVKKLKEEDAVIICYGLPKHTAEIPAQCL